MLGCSARRRLGGLDLRGTPRLRSRRSDDLARWTPLLAPGPIVGMPIGRSQRLVALKSQSQSRLPRREQGWQAAGRAQSRTFQDRFPAVATNPTPDIAL